MSIVNHYSAWHLAFIVLVLESGQGFDFRLGIPNKVQVLPPIKYGSYASH